MNVTIVGGGFGGVKAALELAKDVNTTVTLISDNSNFQYYPALYSTATGHNHRESWVPLEKIFEHELNVTLIKDSIVSIDPKTRSLKGSSGAHYEYIELILALGSVTTYFGIKGLDSYAYGIKSEAEIRKLQSHLFKEMSDGSDDEKHYVIVGAGPTGVELAGALGEYLILLREKFGIRKRSLKINLIEAAPRVLPRLSLSSSAQALKRLRKLGVHVELNKKVEKQTADGLLVNGKPLKTQTVIWTSGVANAPFYKANQAHFTINETGKIVVDEFMRAMPHVYVIGDNAATPYAGLAQTALHDALYVAKHLRGYKRPYKPVSPPCVVPVGHGWALFEWGKIRFSGWLGNIMRLAADMVGYSDILPIGWAITTWRSQKVTELRIPEDVSK